MINTILLEILIAFNPFIEKYCDFEVTKPKLDKLFDDARELGFRITEGDDRYQNSLEDSVPLLLMIHNNAIQEIKVDISSNPRLSEESRNALSKSSWNSVQDKGKITLTAILEDYGYKDIKYEISCISGRCDVYAVHPDIKTIIIGECGPCRLDKIIQSLAQENTELWHLTSENDLYIYKRNKDFDELHKILKDAVEKALKDSYLSIYGIKP